MKAEKGGKAATDGRWAREAQVEGRKENKERKKQRIGKRDENAHRRTSKLHLKLFWGKF